MKYLALYRKYRPADFSSLVGQSEIKKILTRAVVNNNITHAYLFSGPRGTGKTTTAKILAKMINCENLQDGIPCGKCNSCLNLFNNNDVIEIDAASNNGVEEIRNLREKANLVPASCRYKVYIIDEVHMLTTQAFNALLKILEEPPRHVIFILATTEYHKIPLTILSRCQKFQFKKLMVDEIVDKLLEISKEESIDVDREALVEIAKISDGGMRDSINFLDQLRSISDEKITINDVYDVCGNISDNEICDLLLYINESDFIKINLFFENINNKGKSFNKFFEDMLCFLKDVILYKKNVSQNLLKAKIEYVDKVSKLYNEGDLFYIIDSINTLMDKLRYVSRQSIIVISNFLMITNKINGLSDNLKNEKNNDDNKKIENENYELAFDFTSNDVKKEEKFTEDTLRDNKSLNDDLKKNTDIIINNAFAVASKDVKENLQKLFNDLEEYFTNKMFSSVASLFVDTNIEVAGDGYIIFSGKYDAVVDNIYRNYKLSEDFINKLFNGNYKIAIITKDRWNILRKEYINNIKNGKSYKLIDFENSLIDMDIMEKEPTVVDKLFDLVGEDVIEFK